MTETATFAAGCFWGIESAFREIPGVTDAAVGYMGGHTEDPTYEDVCSKTTGHAEVVQLKYDPDVVTYDSLLNAFWQMHDPTQLNRQGADVGDQYRSAIFFHTPQQESAARESKQSVDVSGRFDGPVVTEISPAQTFYRGEEYHQQYLAKRGRGSCRL